MSRKPVTNPRNYSKFTREEAEKYAETVATVFAPLYPVLAGVLVNRFGLTSGVCIDVGSGTAALAVELAKMSDMTIYAVDHADEIQNIAEKRVTESGMEKRVKIVPADAISLPFENNFADFIVSRGSVFFWEKLSRAFNEIYRVLKPGAYACIGSGSGSREIGEQVKRRMLERNPDFEKEGKERLNPSVEKRLEKGLEKSVVPRYTMKRDETGFWITFRKES